VIRFNRPIQKQTHQMTLAEILVQEAEISEAAARREIGGYRTTDPETSKEAARSIDPSKLERKILDVLQGRPGGLTTREMAANLGIDWGSITPRLKPMVAKGLVVTTDEKRRGNSGRRSIVWKAIK
jgi:DNA-binding MarR family transcriptional regulator